jgi:hypothetical protein
MEKMRMNGEKRQQRKKGWRRPTGEWQGEE